MRWALTHGGQNPGTRDDDGFTAIHIAAASNKNKVLQLMLDICRRSRELELIDLRDGEARPACASACGCLRALAVAAAPLAAAQAPLPLRAQGEEMTALMMAAANGFEACVRELLYAGASRHGLALSGPAFAVSLLPRPALAALTRRDAQAPSPRWCARRV